jgi:hypothetical protein
MAKTLASQAKDGGSIPLARSFGQARSRQSSRSAVADYQAWSAPQCGQPTDVDTSAVNT